MSTFTDASKLASVQTARAMLLKTRIRTEHAGMVNALYEENLKALSGNVSAATQRTMGNPYGRGTTKAGKPGRQRKIKGSKTRLPAMPINTITGRLRDSLKVTRKADPSGQTYSMSVGKGLRYARFVLSPDGTRKAVTRPYFAQQQKSWRKRNFDLLVRMREAQRKT